MLNFQFPSHRLADAKNQGGTQQSLATCRELRNQTVTPAAYHTKPNSIELNKDIGYIFVNSFYLLIDLIRIIRKSLFFHCIEQVILIKLQQWRLYNQFMRI